MALVYYFVEMVKGRFQGLTSNEVANVFSDLLGNPNDMIVCSFVVIVVSFAICAIGLQKGVERVTKIMMSLLFCLLIVLAVRSVMLPNAEIGLGYYLYPDFGTMQKIGVPECIFAAISTVIAVIESIVTHGMDLTGCSRKNQLPSILYCCYCCHYLACLDLTFGKVLNRWEVWYSSYFVPGVVGGGGIISI